MLLASLLAVAHHSSPKNNVTRVVAKQAFNATKRNHTKSVNKDSEIGDDDDDDDDDDGNEHVVRLRVFVDNGNATFVLRANSTTNRTLGSVCNTTARPLVKLIAHGFAENWQMVVRWDWVSEMRREMLKSTDSAKLCIVVIDWKELAYGSDGVVANYMNAIANMQVAADLITPFFNQSRVNASNVHCIGE